jgi:hypothetical protein
MLKISVGRLAGYCTKRKGRQLEIHGPGVGGAAAFVVGALRENGSAAPVSNFPPEAFRFSAVS